MVVLSGVVQAFGEVPRNRGRLFAGLRAAVIVAVTGGLLGGVGWPVLGSAERGWERFEALVRRLEL